MIQRDTYPGLTTVRCTFADLPAVLDGVAVSPANRGHYSNKLTTVNNACYADAYGGLQSVDEARSLLTQGWQEGARQASQLAPQLSDIVPPTRDIRRRPCWGDDGSELSLDRALAGQWDCAWRTAKRSARTISPVITLGCAFGGNMNVSHQQLFWCAAQMIVATDILEAAGYSVELRALKANLIRVAYPFHHIIDVLVKNAHAPLRSDAIAAVFGHAGVYRTAGHILIMASSRNVGATLGYNTDVPPHVNAAVAAGRLAPVDYLIPHAYDLGTAARNLTKVLTAITEATNV